MDQERDLYDAVIVGCGISGLSTGLYLQQSGCHVSIVERRGQPGGLCGTFTMDGYEFVIACNDFGCQMEAELAALGVPVSFKSKKIRIHYQDKCFYSPLDWYSILTLLSRPVALAKFLYRVKRGKPRRPEEAYIGPLVERLTKPGKINDLLKIPSYLMGLTPSDFLVEMIDYDASYGYGYIRPRTPDGGPQVLADAMSRCFAARGTLRFNTEFQGASRKDGVFQIQTSNGLIRAKRLISSQARADLYPATAKKGLPLSMFCVAVDKDLHFPAEIHTMIHYEPGISQWYEAIDRGEKPERFGFHLFKSDLPPKADHYTINIYFYLPRGVDEVSAEEAARLERYIFEKAEHMLPGLQRAKRYARLITPAQFRATHQLDCRVTPLVTTPEFHKPDNYDVEQDTYFVGNTVYPPGDHAGASLLGGKLVAERVLADLNRKATAAPHASQLN